jgi:hypothetical protein
MKIRGNHGRNAVDIFELGSKLISLLLGVQHGVGKDPFAGTSREIKGGNVLSASGRK